MGLPLRVVAVAVLFAFAAGCCCSPVGRTGVTPLEPYRYAEVTKRAQRARVAKVVVVLDDGRRFEARDLRIEGGDASWKDAASGREEGAEARLIRQIRFQNRWRGARNTAFYAGLGGLGVGALMGAAEGNTREWCLGGFGYCDYSWEQNAALGGVLLGALGAFLGWWVGLAAGGEDVYQAPLRDLPEPPTPGAEP